MDTVAASLVVYGRVQGVGYRYFCYRHALALQLTGSVRNESDGTVVLSVEGERSHIEDLILKLREGPPGSNVIKIATDWQPPRAAYQTFEIKM